MSGFLQRPLLLVATLASLATAALVPCPAAARPPLGLAPIAAGDDAREEDAHLAIDLHEAASHPLWREGHGGHTPLWFSVGGLLALPSVGSREVGVLVMLGLPLDRLARRAARPADVAPRGRTLRLDGTHALADDAAPALKPAARRPRADGAGARPAGDRDGPAPLPSAPAQPVVVEPAPAVAVAITPAVARAAVRAALRSARLAAPDAAMDALASRARASSLLPELRLRALRRADDGQALAPTEYDPTRTTATTGTSVWLEARATWRLDRLVFADDEVAIERLRSERAAAQARLVERVLDLLFGWQRAVAAEADPKRTPEERIEAALRRIESEAALDVCTDGWFSRWQGASP